MLKHAKPFAKPRWPTYVGIFVFIGSLATVAYAFAESWFG
jgi:hypothetical protein